MGFSDNIHQVQFLVQTNWVVKFSSKSTVFRKYFNFQPFIRETLTKLDPLLSTMLRLANRSAICSLLSETPRDSKELDLVIEIK